MERIYLDNNATTCPLPAVIDAVREAMEVIWGNPSSIHRSGQEARQRVDLARESVAGLIGARTREVTFTSGGTEAANLAIHSALAARPDRRVVVTSKVEHPAVSEKASSLTEGGRIEVVVLENDGDGVVDMEHLRRIVVERGATIALVSLMWCNNETGVIQPVEQAAAICREHDVLMHSDATQWVGKMPMNVARVPVDIVTFAAHKLHGPKGAGAVYLRSDLALHPLVTGGPQERGRRGGTENVPAILGFGVAAEAAAAWLTDANIAHMEAQRDMFGRGLRDRMPEMHVHSAGASRAWTTSSVAFPGFETEVLLLMLSERGVCASGGSACTSGAFKQSQVLQALTSPGEGTWGTLRFSFARTTRRAELEAATDVVMASLARLDEVRAAAPPP